MAFKKQMDLDGADASNTYNLHGNNKTTGKANPSSITGFYLGAKTIKSDFSASGTALVHVFQTAKGIEGIYGKTDSDKRMAQVKVGSMVRLSCTGTKPIKGKAPMITYTVEIDEDQSYDGELPNISSAASAPAVDELDDEPATFSVDEEEQDVDPLPPPARKPVVAASAPTAAKTADIRAKIAAARQRA